MAATAGAQTKSFVLDGFITGRSIRATGQPSWIDNGFGRLDYGGTGVDKSRNLAEAVTQLGMDWTPSRYFDVHVAGLARTKPAGDRGKSAGFVEAYADARMILRNDEIRLRAGQFFLPSSRENRGPLWSSPYTLSFSAINTWIGQEVRPVGLDLEWKRGFYFTFGATAFRNNDTMGTLLAWRGWTVGDRLTVYNELLPLPPISSLTKDDFLGFQRPDGTVPFEKDLDGRTGFSERVRFTLPERGLIQLLHLDNRGDLQLYHGEYSWKTKYDQISAQAGNPETSIIAAEWMSGSTAMGLPQFSHVYVDFRSAYVLLSRKQGRTRLSIRGDTFTLSDQAHAAINDYSEHGHAITATVMYDLSQQTRATVEWTKITGNRRAAAQSGFDPNASGRTIIAELRYSF
ncbi:MAG: hypothetical protein JWN02_1906 [Acidobacteria bacterium]|nr:hypothetical protein [Acidobacteriota bacterium]